ncbi:MAG TPA: hypothetical protein VMU95_31015, partial [Trebonia sp.]|nr:hypothetical protein [Trebonia sp.]
MNPMPVPWRRSRRGMRRALAVICSIAALAYGAVAVTAAPARADQTISSGGPTTLTWPGGDMVASQDATGVSPAVM